MQLIGTNQYGVTVYKIEEGFFYFTAYIDASTFLEVSFKTKTPERVTIQRLLKEVSAGGSEGLRK